MSENISKRRNRRERTRMKAAIVILVLVVVIGICIVQVADLVKKGREKADNYLNSISAGEGADGLPDTAGPATGGNEAGNISDDDGIVSLWYYDPARAERYNSFAASHPQINAEDIVWMVDADLDLQPYTDTKEAEDPSSLFVLVNKHFSLPEGYVPEDLVEVGDTRLRKDAADAVKEMIVAAAAEGHRLWSQSGFRPYELQVSLYSQYSAQDGKEAADTYSARPGFSEHQTGWTTDLNTITDDFGDTAEGKWAAANCWEYGFIIRYSEENTDITLYKPEPWHIRYIGRAAARTMHEEGIISFEEYWVKYVRYAPPWN